MTGAEFREARIDAGLSVRKAAEVLGVTSRTISRWQIDEAPIPSAVAKRIRELSRGLAQTSIGETLGRIVAILEDVAPITAVDRQRVSTEPAHLALLLRNAHRPALAERRRAIEDELTALMNDLPPTLPETLREAQQAAYWVGYYQRRGERHTEETPA